MIQIHEKEKKQFRKLFQQEGIDRFEDRFKVLEVFLQIESHVTVEELMERLSDEKDIDAPFVRETLKLMCQFGFAQKNRFDNGQLRYEHRHLGHHHDHMICTKCRKITEFKDEQLEKLQLQIAERNGFHMLQHRMEIYGICAACASNRERQMPLTMAKPGERVVIKEFSGGAGARLRLTSMGFRIGDEIQIVTNQVSGQLVVSLDFNRYVLGRGLAQKIMVQSIRKKT